MGKKSRRNYNNGTTYDAKENAAIPKTDDAKENADTPKTDGTKEHKRFFEIHLVSRQKGNRITKKKLNQKKVNLTMEIFMIALIALVFLSVFGFIRFIK